MKQTVTENMKKRMAKIIGNESGVTLIELLAVVVILAIIAAVAVPAVMGNMNKSKLNTDAQNEQIIVDAIQRAVVDQSSSNGNSVTGIAKSDGSAILNNGGTVEITSSGPITLFGTFGSVSYQTVTLIGNYLNQFPTPQAASGQKSTNFMIGDKTYTLSESSTADQWTIAATN